ncbi:MAG: hypothetical protein ACI4OZ_00825, partial [Akkermansia sp.]
GPYECHSTPFLCSVNTKMTIQQTLFGIMTILREKGMISGHRLFKNASTQHLSHSCILTGVTRRPGAVCTGYSP